MKALTAGTLLLALSAVAFAKTSPVERPPLALLITGINRGAAHEDIGAADPGRLQRGRAEPGHRH